MIAFTLALITSAFLAHAPVQDAPTAATTAEVQTPAQRLIELGQRENRVSEHLEALCEQFPHRLLGSKGLSDACNWAEARFAAMGLDARQEKWGSVPVGFERGPQVGKLLVPEERPLSFVTNAWTPGTVGLAAGPVVLEPKALADFDPALYKDAWILRRGRGDRPEASERRELDAKLIEAGVLGELRDGGRNPIVDGRYTIDWNDLPQWVSIKLVREEFAHLTNLVEAGEVVTQVAFQIDNRFVEGPIDQFNVIADIKGSEFPDEYVIVGGHIDDWDAAQGAQDNGTGMATTFEAARLIMASGIQPRRTIRFMFWGGEEQGLLGSAAYAKAHPEVCAKTSAVLVHDGGGNYLSGIAGPAALVEDLRTVFAPLATLNPDMPFEVKENRGLSTWGASDHASFVAQGVPGFFWNQTGELDYDYVHHTRFDTLDQVNPEYQKHSAIVVAVGAMGLANLDHMLDRTDLIRQTTMPSNRRTMGVFLEGNLVTGVVDGGQAAKLGLKENDLIIAVDKVAVGSREEIVTEMHKGDPKKTVTIQRGETKLDVVFTWEQPKKDDK